jgi:hypothetical protein
MMGVDGNSPYSILQPVPEGSGVMSTSPAAEHFASWLCLALGHNVSCGPGSARRRAEPCGRTAQDRGRQHWQDPPASTRFVDASPAERARQRR